MKIINSELLYGNKDNAIALCEYQRELQLTKNLIDIAIELINIDTIPDSESQNGICHSFAKSVVCYCRDAYDNMVIGHFHAARMLLRSSMENLFCLELLHKHKDLWKYYLVHSCWEGFSISNRKPTDKELKSFSDICDEYNISEEFLIKPEKTKKAYIDEPYGWTYQVNPNKKFTFKELCKLVKRETEYSGYRMLSVYSHGTTYYLKMGTSVFDHDIIPIFCDIYVNLCRVIEILCLKGEDGRLAPIVCELGELIEKRIHN